MNSSRKYEATIQFIANRKFTEEDFSLLLKHRLTDRDIVPGSVECVFLEDDENER